MESGADIYLAALRFGKYPALAASSSVKSCYLFIIYRDNSLPKKGYPSCISRKKTSAIRTPSKLLKRLQQVSCGCEVGVTGNASHFLKGGIMHCEKIVVMKQISRMIYLVITWIWSAFHCVCTIRDYVDKSSYLYSIAIFLFI